MRAWGEERKTRSPGEGPALLQGIVVCGICGRHMNIRYHQSQGKLFPYYTCMSQKIEFNEDTCQNISGRNIDPAIAKLLLEQITPQSLKLAIAVQKEVQIQLEETDRLRYRHVEQAQYHADLARERFMAVDPQNRMVASQLEADWNDKLRLLEDAREEYEKDKKNDRIKLDSKCRQQIMSLVKDFPAAWNANTTTDRQRKRMVRLLIEDVTLTKYKEYTKVQIRFRGGVTKEIEVPNPLTA